MSLVVAQSSFYNISKVGLARKISRIPSAKISLHITPYVVCNGSSKIDDDEQINAKDQSIFKHHQTLNVYWYGPNWAVFHTK